MGRFSPVARIQWVATQAHDRPDRIQTLFQSRCQDSMGCDISVQILSHISYKMFQSRCQDSMGCDLLIFIAFPLLLYCFSPVARIQWVATSPTYAILNDNNFSFQSRCQDSMGCDSPTTLRCCLMTWAFQSRCQDSMGCDYGDRLA